MPTTFLLDNGSRRAQSTLALRRLATGLGERIGQRVHPVSLAHADKVPASALADRPAETFEPFLRRQIGEGIRDFVAVPLFFGPSRALTELIPETVGRLAGELAAVRLTLADPLCPLPDGEPRLVQILLENLRRAAARAGVGLERVVLVDHGSPIPEVTAVRRALAGRLREALGTQTTLGEAVMERRAGSAYDFNGSLLETVLAELAGAAATPVFLSLLFLSPGRHAGPGGDIEQIAARVCDAHPRLRVITSPLVAEHPLLLEILEDRYRDAVVGGVPIAASAPERPSTPSK